MNENNYNELIKGLSSKLGVSSDEISSAVKSGNTDSILKDAENRRQLSDVLNDPEKIKRVLNSEKAQALLKLLEKDK